MLDKKIIVWNSKMLRELTLEIMNIIEFSFCKSNERKKEKMNNYYISIIFHSKIKYYI